MWFILTHTYMYIYAIIVTKEKSCLVKFLTRNLGPWKLRETIDMEGIWQNIKQLPDLLSTIVHSAILKTMSHYIGSELSGYRCLSDLFSSVRDNQDVGIYFQSHSIPFRAVKAKASLLHHKMVEIGRGLLLEAGSQRGACWGHAEFGFVFIWRWRIHNLPGQSVHWLVYPP